MSTYRIADEPRPGMGAQLAVNPFWPFLATMFAGAWLAWPWFVFNSFAIGSATRTREVLLVVMGFLGIAGFTFVAVVAFNAGVWTRAEAGYVQTGLLVWKLGISYALHIHQNRSFELHEYFGGVSRNGLFLVVGGFFLRGYVFGRAPAWLALFL
jgi:hypothetical protein